VRRLLPPRPENKRVWASLLKGKTAVIEEVAAEMDRRDPARSATRLALTDGERALQIRVDQKHKVTLILDLMHVLEKLWKAAYVFHAEGSLEADLWVLDRTLRILFGEVGQVVKGIRQSITKRGLTGPKRKTLHAVSPTTSIATAPECAITNTSRQRLANCQRPSRRRLQKPHQRSNGTLRNALDRANGGGHRSTPSHISLRRF
jgi:hypothetical protein